MTELTHDYLCVSILRLCYSFQSQNILCYGFALKALRMHVEKCHRETRH